MKLFLGSQQLQVTDAHQIGEGGEARVFAHGDLALKVFHRLSALHERKLRAFPSLLPKEVMAPRGLLTDSGGKLVGYAMPLVRGVDVLGRLQQRRWREGNIDHQQVLSLFARLQALVAQLHAAQVVVGDLNDGNVLFAKDTLVLIDADSLQFGGMPCPVGHERYLDPRLYGVDLGAAPAFTPQTDWYALAVMLFSSLLYVHPFGGVHTKWPTLTRRAEARHSVLKPDVVYPKAAAPFRVLPDAALSWFEGVFERDVREPPPPSVVGLQFSRCRCGLEHARGVCPACQALGPISARQAVRSSGRCTARTLFETSGRVLAAALQGGVRYVYEEAGRVRREDGSLVSNEAAPLGARYAISGASTWWAERSGQLTKVLREQVVERARTGVNAGTPVVAANANASYRIEQEWLVEQETGARVGQVLENQTQVWLGPSLGFGFYRVGALTVAFITRPGRSGLKAVRLPQLVGRIVQTECVFDARHALFSVVLEQGGAVKGLHWLIDDGGQVLGEGEHPYATGKALLNGCVLCATPQGLLSLSLDGRRLVPGTLFSDAAELVDPTDELLAQPDGSLVIVTAQSLLQLSLS